MYMKLIQVWVCENVHYICRSAAGLGCHILAQLQIPASRGQRFPPRCKPAQLNHAWRWASMARGWNWAGSPLRGWFFFFEADYVVCVQQGFLFPGWRSRAGGSRERCNWCRSLLKAGLIGSALSACGFQDVACVFFFFKSECSFQGLLLLFFLCSGPPGVPSACSTCSMLMHAFRGRGCCRAECRGCGMVLHAHGCVLTCASVGLIPCLTVEPPSAGGVESGSSQALLVCVWKWRQSACRTGPVSCRMSWQYLVTYTSNNHWKHLFFFPFQITLAKANRMKN